MEKTRKCPYCGEEIMADAKKCRYCGEWLNDEAEPKQEPVPETAIKESENQPRNEIVAATAAVKEPLADSEPNKPNESLFKSCFWEQITKHYCDFKGNADRKTFWICYLYWMLIMWVIGGISIWLPLVGTVLMWIVSLGLTLPFLGLSVRRLHDIGKKGAWILIALVPLVGPIWYLVLMAQKGESQNPNKWNVKDTVITIAMLVVSIGLYVLGLSGITSNLTEGISRKDNWLEIGTDNAENESKAELEQYVLKAYKTHEIYNLQTLDFKAAEEAAIAADVPGYATCIDWDYFYSTQEDPDLTRVTDVQAEMVDENKAHVYVTLEYEWGSEPTTLILIMIREDLKGKWLVDDVRTTGEFEGSIKELMYKCANESQGYDDYEVDENDYEVVKEVATDAETPQNTDIDQTAIKENKFVVIDGSDLRLRLGPSTSSETLKWGDGSNRHPEVGEVFRLLDETEDFYKIDYKGNEVWVSKQFSHIEIQ